MAEFFMKKLKTWIIVFSDAKQSLQSIIVDGTEVPIQLAWGSLSNGHMYKAIPDSKVHGANMGPI